MNFRRRNNGYWTKESSARAHAAKARKRLESPPISEPRRVPDKELLYTIQIQESSGQVRKWVIKQGPRANNIRVSAKGREVVCGWDRFMRCLRRNLSIQKRIFS